MHLSLHTVGAVIIRHTDSHSRLCLALQVGILPYAGVDITTFEVLKDLLLEHYEGQPPTSSVLMAGMVSSSVAQFVSYPLALVRTRLQVGTRTQ